jgi:hypothetical protein
MVAVLLSHGWKKFTRSVSFAKDVATKVFVGIFGFIIVLYSVGLGFALEIIITKVLKQTDSILFLNGILLYYFGFEFIMRYMMQNMPVMDIQPYLHLPMKKSKMIHYLLVRSLVHVLNFLPWLIFTPFAFSVIAPEHGVGAAWSWLLTVWFCSLMLHFLVLLFKKKLDDNIYGILTLLSLIVLFGAADYYQWFQLSWVSASLFGSVFSQPILFVMPVLVIVGLYYANFKFFVHGTYPEEMAFQKSSGFNKSGDVGFLKNFGLIGEMINVEIKLILRNKRPRNILYLSAFFLLYGLIFYTNDKYMGDDFSGILLFVGIFITGIFMINYGQLLLSWQGGHYDFTLTRPVSMRQYVESKYWLLSAVVIICFVLSTPYVYFGWQILMMQFAMTLFNMGINVFVILNLSMWDPKKVDLQKGVTFNYEGVGAAQWVMSIPILLGPYLFYLPFSLAGYPTLGIIAVGLAGVIGITLRNQLIGMTTKRLMDRKYKIAAGFRKD